MKFRKFNISSFGIGIKNSFLCINLESKSIFFLKFFFFSSCRFEDVHDWQFFDNLTQDYENFKLKKRLIFVAFF